MEEEEININTDGYVSQTEEEVHERELLGDE